MKRWVPVVVWMVAIFVVSHQPSSELPDFGWIDLLVKKAGHFLAYAILALLTQRAWRPESASWKWAFLITVVYAATDELHQRFIPGRFGSLADVLIDSSGALTALLAKHYWLSVHASPLTDCQALDEAQLAQTVPVDELTPPAA